MKIIDLSLPIDDSVFEPIKVEIKRWEHKRGGDRFGLRWAFARGIRGIFNYVFGKERITHNSFKDGAFLALEQVKATVHTGTHLDAPYHFGPLSEGRKAKKIVEIPLEWCYGDGVVLDLSYKKPGEFITKEDIGKALKKIRYEIKPFDIVLIRTGADKFWGTKKYFSQFPGMSKEAVAYILEFNVKIIGIDAFSFDRPLVMSYNSCKKRVA